MPVSNLSPITVRASNSSQTVADYSCSGTNDQNTVRSAINQILASGSQTGKIFLYAGDYNFDGLLGVPAGITIEGANMYTTKIYSKGNHDCIISEGFSTGSIPYNSQLYVELRNFTIIAGTGSTFANYAIRGAFSESRFEFLHIDHMGKGISLNEIHDFPGFISPGGYLNKIMNCNIVALEDSLIMSYRNLDSWILTNNMGAGRYNINLNGGPYRILNNHLNGTGSDQPIINIFSDLGINSAIIQSNICENAKYESIKILRVSNPSIDNSNICFANNNIRYASQASSGTYNMVTLIGNGQTLKGITFVGNLFEQRGNAVNSVIALNNCSEITISGNDLGVEALANEVVEIVNTDKVQIFSNSHVGLNDYKQLTKPFDVDGDYIRINDSRAPVASDPGESGQICWDKNYIFVCVSSGDWKRAEIFSY